MLTIIVFVILAGVISTYVVLPLVHARTKKINLGKEASNHRATDLVERKESIYAAIKEIEFDYEMGKLSENDFKDLRQQYKEEAVGLLKNIDEIQMRKGRHSKPKQDKKPGAQSLNYCWMCGTAVSKDDRFCANCGNNLE